MNSASKKNTSEKRQKKAYERTMTPSTLRNALQEKLKNQLPDPDTSHLAGTIRSLGEEVREDHNRVEKDRENETLSYSQDQKNLPPSIPRHMRNISREDDQFDNVDVDEENIETPPFSRKSYGTSCEQNQWSTATTPSADDDFIGRRGVNKYRSLNSEERRALVGERKSGENMNSKRFKHGVDSSENEGNGSEIDDKSSHRRSMRFKRLADLAKDCDSETEQMLARQTKKVENDIDDDLGDGNFQRFSSVRKTLRHKKTQDVKQTDDRADSAERTRKTPEKVLSTAKEATQEVIKVPVYKSESTKVSNEVEENQEARLKRWQQQKGNKVEEIPIEKKKDCSPESWKDKISRKFKHAEIYDVQRAECAERSRGDISITDGLSGKRQNELIRGSETRSSHKILSSTHNEQKREKRERNKSAIDSAQLRAAIEKEKLRQPPSRADKVFSRLASKEKNSSFRRNEPITRSLRENSSKVRSVNKYINPLKDDKDEGFEDTISVKSETTSQGNSSNNGETSEAIQDKTPMRTLGERLKGLRRDSSSERKIDANSRSRGSLRSSRSSLTSATSVNTVRPRQISNSPSNASIVSNKSDTNNKIRNISSPFQDISKSLRNEFVEEYDRTQSSPTSPSREVPPPYSKEKTYSNNSLHSSGGVTPTKPISRTNSQKSVGSLSKQSSDGSLRRSAKPTSTATSASKSLSLTKKTQTLSNRLSSGISQRNKMSASDSLHKKSATPLINGGARVRRGESGSFKENLSQTNSENTRNVAKSGVRSINVRDQRTPLVDRSASLRVSSKSNNEENLLTKRKPINSPNRTKQVPAFMRPTTSSSSKKSMGGTDSIKTRKEPKTNSSLNTSKSTIK